LVEGEPAVDYIEGGAVNAATNHDIVDTASQLKGQAEVVTRREFELWWPRRRRWPDSGHPSGDDDVEPAQRGGGARGAGLLGGESVVLSGRQRRWAVATNRPERSVPCDVEGPRP
jgi:hypothetical protein